MSKLNTNTVNGDARERTKNLENITIMGTANQNLQTSQNVKTTTLNFNNNKLNQVNNHTNLLKVTHGYYNLQPCCDLSKQKATSLSDGLKTKINVGSNITLANSSCNRQPLYDSNDCNIPKTNMISNVTKNNFNYPVPLEKLTCCNANRSKPNIQINSTENHTKYIPIMSKIKKYQYRTTDTTDPIQYPNFNTINKNNMVGYFKNDIYKTSTSCSTSCNTGCTTTSSTATTSCTATTSSATTGHKLKYTVQNTNANCSCADYDDYKIQTSTTSQATPSASTAYTSYFSRKWSKNSC